MKNEKNENNKDKKEDKAKPKYVPPNIITYTEEELLEQIGPAQACTGQPCGIN
ncbi:MAG: hypothetical protein HQK79_08440 [Desulfobacterales bacterium]|nr:hypothetical protein [Desulfobacterales bacterium]MBF0398218.1 hypothetical protein [Desulfobacterales bacterium]